MPGPGADVVVPAGTRIALDADTAPLGSLVVEGELIAAPGRDVVLTADSVFVRGPGARFEVGRVGAPFEGDFTLVLTGTDPHDTIAPGVAKAVMTGMGGTLSLHGRAKTGSTRLGASVAAGDASLRLRAAPSGWRVGDEIAVAPTDFEPLEAERGTIVAIDGARVTVDAPFEHFHWGETPRRVGDLTLDMRAHVVNLTRNVTITSADDDEIDLPGFDPESRDTDGNQDGAGRRVAPGRFGGHMMFMGGSKVMLDNIEVTRLGQQGVLARYPVHWHLPRDRSVEDNWIRGSAVHSTFQRGIVLHQTNGVEVQDNVLFDIPGHAVFLEDGIEHDNTVTGNTVILVRHVPRRHRLGHNRSLQIETSDRMARQAGFWITNPANTITGNTVAGVQSGWGFAFVGVLEDKVPVIDPADEHWAGNRGYTAFRDNTAYSIGYFREDPDGVRGVFNLGYGPEEAGSCFRFDFPGDVSASTPVEGLTAFKCANAASWSTNFLPIRRSVFADSRTGIVNNQGEGSASVLQDGAMVAMTANNPPGRTDFTQGPFLGPVLSGSHESGPVVLENVTVAGDFLADVESASASVSAAAAPSAGFTVLAPDVVTLPANGAASATLRIDRSGGHDGPVTFEVAIPRAPNLVSSNPYHFVGSAPATIPAGATETTLELTLGEPARPGDARVELVARGDSTRLHSMPLLTATVPEVYESVAHGDDVARTLPLTNPRNPAMSGRVRNHGGDESVDGDPSTAARLTATPTPWWRGDLLRGYVLRRVVLDWHPEHAPSGDVWVSLSQYPILDGVTLDEARVLPDATHHRLRPQASGRMTLELPSGTAARVVKVWATVDEEIWLREGGAGFGVLIARAAPRRSGRRTRPERSAAAPAPAARRATTPGRTRTRRSRRSGAPATSTRCSGTRRGSART